MRARWVDHAWYCFAHQSGYCSCRPGPAAVVRSAEGRATDPTRPGASAAMKEMASDALHRATGADGMSDHLRPSSDPTGCTDPQPIRVRTGSAAVAVFCARCMYRTEVVSDYRTAQQRFDSIHGATS